MLRFRNANDQQLIAINHINGPLLIVAGPGTGKTYTLINRALNLIVNKKVEPSKIFFSTFTEKSGTGLKVGAEICLDLYMQSYLFHPQESYQLI